MEEINAIPLSKRQSVSKKMLEQYNDRIPVVFVKGESRITIKSSKFLAPKEFSMAQFLMSVRDRCDITESEAIYLLTESNKLIPSSYKMEEIYKLHKNKDNFLYLIYNTENVFGKRRNFNFL